MSTQASAALSLAGHMSGSSASRLSSCCTRLSFQARPASEGHQTPPLMLPGCSALGLVPLWSETGQLLLPAPAPPVPLQPGEPTPQQRLRAAQRSDDTNIMSLAEADPCSTQWAHTWKAIHSCALDRPGRVVAWRLLHGKLFVGAFHRHIHRGTPASHLCPHAHCQEQRATLSHVMLSCILSHAVWQWFVATWAAVSQQPAPPPARRPPAGRRQAWSLAACSRLGQPVAETSPPGYHPAVGGILPLSLTARVAHTASTHRCQGDIRSQ